MDNLDTGKDKIKQICEILKNETIQPAKEEAQKIVEGAEQEARNIIRDAETKADNILQSAKSKITKERELFENSIAQACRQGIESLRQDIENKLFNSELTSWVTKHTADTHVASKLINALVAAVEKEGVSADFSAIIPKHVPSEKVNAILLRGILEKLREKSVVVGEFMGGVQLKLHDRKMTLDLSDEALKELIGQYIRKDFREILFKND
jgi:V/A-type H+/Na+-transporting ATPase subunit E